MAENDSIDLLTAFAIGAMIGVGATLLMRSEPETATERLLGGVRPIARRAKKAAGRAAKRYGKSVSLTRKATRDLGGAGRDVMEDLHKEIEDILASARDELGATARRKMRSARKAIHRFRS
jgi:hypothetical protein